MILLNLGKSWGQNEDIIDVIYSKLILFIKHKI